jgi:hydroxymethylbilane synthase
MIVKIGTRGSKLAVSQSNWVKAKIERAHPEVHVKLVLIRTTGDRILNSPLSKIGGKGLFVKEIEESLLKKQVDLAVHSMKDVPAELPPGLTLCCFPAREDPRDALISHNDKALEDLPGGTRVGTGSLRRASQLMHLRPDLDIQPLRGNVDTRLRKLDQGELQAIILATAGLKRLALSDRISQIITEKQILPAIGQGALGLEIREDNEVVAKLLGFLNHEETETIITAERAFLKALGGGCQVPIGALGGLNENGLCLTGLIADLDGTKLIRDHLVGEKTQAEQIGDSLARRILTAGGNAILARVYGKQG